MTYSIDLRERAVMYVREGGRVSEASRLFKIGRVTLYGWLKRGSLSPKRHGRRKRKLDWAALREDMTAHPDLLLRERAAKFHVHPSAIFYACRQMGFSHKKNTALCRAMS